MTQEQKISDHFEKEIFFLRKKLQNPPFYWSKFYKTVSVHGSNRKTFPEYDVIIADIKDKEIVKIEVKAQKNLIIEQCEINTGQSVQKPSGLSQCLADVYYFFNFNNDNVVKDIDADKNITYDLYIIPKMDIEQMFEDNYKPVKEMIDKQDEKDVKENDFFDLDDKDPDFINKSSKLQAEINNLQKEILEIDKTLYFSRFHKLNHNNPNKNGIYNKNTGFGVLLHLDNLKKYLILSNQQSIKKSVKDSLISNNIQINNSVISGPDIKPATGQPCGRIIDNNLDENIKWLPDNIDNTIQIVKIDVEQYKIPKGSGKNNSSSESNSSSSSEGEETCLKLYNRLKRNINKKYKGKRGKYL